MRAIILSLVFGAAAIAQTWSQPVREVDKPARSAVHAQGTATWSILDEPIAATIYTVPASKRLVIETVTSACATPGTETLLRVWLRLTLNGVQALHQLDFELKGTTTSGLKIYAGSQQLRLYADAGSVVRGQAVRDRALSIPQGCTFTVAGYLESIP